MSLWSKNYTIITIGTIISAIGGVGINFAIGVLVYNQTQSTLLTALFSAVVMIPNILFPLFIGPTIDRFSRKNIIVRSDMFMGLVFFILKKPLLKRLPFKLNRKIDKALSFLISGSFVFLLGTLMSAALLSPIFANGEQVIDHSFLHFFKSSGSSIVDTINDEVKEVGIITKLIEKTPLTLEDQEDIVQLLVSFKLPEDVATTLSKYPLKQEVTQEEKTRLLEYAQEEGLTLEDVRTFLKSLGLSDDVIEELISNAN